LGTKINRDTNLGLGLHVFRQNEGRNNAGAFNTTRKRTRRKMAGYSCGGLGHQGALKKDAFWAKQWL